jgi:hypothetical protein
MARLRLGLCGLVGVILSMTACFSPDEPACAFSCVTDGICPTAYACGSDGLCHRDDGVGVCGLDPLVHPGDAGLHATDAGLDGGAAGAAD